MPNHLRKTSKVTVAVALAAGLSGCVFFNQVGITTAKNPFCSHLPADQYLACDIITWGLGIGLAVVAATAIANNNDGSRNEGGAMAGDA